MLNDSTVLAWDVMNEPPASSTDQDHYYTFVRSVFSYIKQELRPRQPVAVSCDRDGATGACGTWGDTAWDIFLIHPYWHTSVIDGFEPAGFESMKRYVNAMVARANKVNKPVLATETCWGANDDAVRAYHCRAVLEVLKAAGIGFMPHALRW